MNHIFKQNALFMAPQANVGEWVRKADTARTQMGGAVVNGKIYAIGGWTGNPISTVEAYDPTNDEWTEKASMPTKRFIENGAIVIDGLIYVIGGNNVNQQLSVVQEYDTGFRPSQAIESKGKLSTTWGNRKR